MKRFALITFAIAAFSAPALAQVEVKDPWVRGTVAQQTATGAFMQIRSQKAARLVEVKSPAAKVVEIHEMRMEKDVMKMRAVRGIDLPAGKTVDLQSGGYHVMLMGLKQPLKAGDTVPLTLVIEGADRKRETVEVQAPVRPLNTPAPGDSMKTH